MIWSRSALILAPLNCACAAPGEEADGPGTVRFAAIADCQFADAPDAGQDETGVVRRLLLEVRPLVSINV